MSFINYLKFAFDTLVRSWKSFVLIVVLGIISLMLLMSSLFYRETSVYTEKKMDKLLTSGISSVGKISIIFTDEGEWESWGEELKNIESFCEEAYQMPEISALGDISLSGYLLEGSEELFEIQKGNGISYENELEGRVEFLCMSMRVWDLCKLRLSEGIPPKQAGITDREQALYLGNAFKDIPIGKQYFVKSNDGTIIVTYTIAGILEEGSGWIPESYTAGATNRCIDLDYGVICLSENGFGTIPFYFASEEGTMFSNVAYQLDELAKRYGINITVSPLQDEIKQDKLENALLISYINQLLYIILIVCVTVQMCVQSVGILMNLPTYGILYANGATLRDLTWILLLENIVKNTLILIVALGIFNIQLPQLVGSSKNALNEGREIFMHIMPNVALVAVGIAIISAIVPVLILRSYSPTRLIGDNI